MNNIDLKKQLELKLEELSNYRDSLEDLIGEAKEARDSVNRAYDSLEDAIQYLSELV